MKAKEAATGKTLRGKENDADITAAFDAADDEDVVFQDKFHDSPRKGFQFA